MKVIKKPVEFTNFDIYAFIAISPNPRGEGKWTIIIGTSIPCFYL
jgi:formyltetrahydrofolate synthetase